MKWFLLCIVLVFSCIQSDAGAQERFTLDQDEKRVARHDAKGKVVWSKVFDDQIGGVRWPHLVWDEKRVYITHNDGVTALDAEKGTLLWHSKGSNARLL